MLHLLKKLCINILWDETTAQRYLSVGCYLFGELLSTGGVVPGTTYVVSWAQEYFQFGPYLQAIGLYFGAGGYLPSFKKGVLNGN